VLVCAINAHTGVEESLCSGGVLIIFVFACVLIYGLILRYKLITGYIDRLNSLNSDADSLLNNWHTEKYNVIEFEVEIQTICKKQQKVNII